MSALTAEYYLPLTATQDQVDEAWAWCEATVDRMALDRHLSITSRSRSVTELAVWINPDGDPEYRVPQGDDVATDQRLRVVATTVPA